MRWKCFSVVLFLQAVAALPPFQWDTVPTYVHCANMSGPWNAMALDRMTHKGVGFVVFEKVHGLFWPPVNTSAETKIAAACKQVKDAATAKGVAAPDCYQYVEVDWARTWYTLGHEVDADQAHLAMHWEANNTIFNAPTPVIAWKKGPGTPPINGSTKFSYPTHAYDFRSTQMQAKWAARITDAVATGHVDGAFVDGNRGGWGYGGIAACADHADKAKQQQCAADMSAGLAAAHKAVATALSKNNTLISNYPTPEALQYCNGGMCERCGSDIKTVLMLQKDYAHRKCGLWNQSCVLEYRPFGTGHHFPPYTALGNRSIAAFLLAAGPHSYYGANSESGMGPDACFGDGGSMTIPTWPDMQRPLGVPQGDLKNSSAANGGWALTRIFGGGAAVTKVAMSPSWACIWWSDGFITGDKACKMQTREDVGALFADWLHRRTASPEVPAVL